MNEFYFLIRHTPFWAIPLALISGEFAYLFWLRKKKLQAKICLSLLFPALLALGWYYYAGGPDKAVKKLIRHKQSLDL